VTHQTCFSIASSVPFTADYTQCFHIKITIQLATIHPNTAPLCHFQFKERFHVEQFQKETLKFSEYYQLLVVK
jgi:hypothetical protein